jgi:hypothetical protein
VTENVAVAALAAAELVLDGLEPEDVCCEVGSYRIPFAVAAAAEEEGKEDADEDETWRRSLLLEGVDDAAAESDVVDGRTISSAAPTRWECPSNVTSAFSLMQDKLAELKRARMTGVKRGIEKFACAASMRRGIESPRVTFVYSGSVDMVVVVHPLSPATEHVEPVKPLMHMHEQLPVERADVPPF